MKTCKTCGVEKPEAEFHKDRQKTDGLSIYCKPCFIAKQREYQKRPPKNPAPAGMKRCSRCKETKPVAEFHAKASQYDGLDRRCKTCSYELHKEWIEKFPEKAAALQKRWRENNPQRSADHKLKQNYGIPLGTYERMFKAQNGRCAICGTEDPGTKNRDGTPGRFHVDHCHGTGNVRALLCHHCNVALGSFGHDREILIKAREYLLRHEASSRS